MHNNVSFFATLHCYLARFFCTSWNFVKCLKWKLNLTTLLQSNSVEDRVLRPLQQLVDIFQGPVRLCQKRSDKLMDYTAASQKLKQNKETSKKHQYEEELQLSKTTYEALNSQLVDELPVLIELASGVFSQCVQQFILSRKLYVGSCTKELLAIMEVR